MTWQSTNSFATTGNRQSFGRGRLADEDTLLRLVDVGLIGIICLAPYFFGGRHDLGRLVYVALVALTAIVWFARQVVRPVSWNIAAEYAVALSAVALIGVQVVPLPASWVSWLAPRNAALVPLWAGSNELVGTWRTISVAPHETTKALAVLAAHCLLFVVVMQRVISISDIKRVLSWIGISATLMAAFGLVQFFTSNAKFFWFYEVPYRSTYSCACGSFTNRNHFANFLVLGVGPLAYLLIASLKRRGSEPMERMDGIQIRSIWQTVAFGAALTVVLFAIVLSMSRGGVLGLLVAVCVAGAIYAHGGVIDSRYTAIAVALVAFVIGLLSIYGYDQFTRRFATLAKGSMEAVDSDAGRRQIWQANVSAIEEGGLLGAGAGTHLKIYPVYTADSQFGQYTHAECGYLQIVTETGLLGASLLFAAIGLGMTSCYACWKGRLSDTETLFFGAIAGGLAASLVHSIVDFVWFIPACMSITLILSACLLRIAQIARCDAATNEQKATSHRLPIVNAGFAVTISCVGAWMVWTFVGPGMASLHWDRYLRVSIANRDASRHELANLVANRQLSKETDGHYRAMHQAMTRHLERALAWDPNFAEARLKLARRQLDEFELRQQAAANTMDVDQIRDAAIASAFKSPAELQAWLQRAFGENSELLDRALVNAHAVVSQSPLSGDGYLMLAKLCFLEGGDRNVVKSYIDQGLRVRPYDGELLYEVGLYEFASGQHEPGLAHWKQCFRTVGAHQMKVIYSTAGRIPAAMFVEEFRPDWQTLPKIWTRYREFGSANDLDVLLKYAAAQADRECANASGDRAGAMWLNLAAMYRELQMSTDELACLRRSYSCSPSSFDVRLALGQSLLKAEQFAEAEPHFRWCLARRPTNRDLSTALAEICERRRAVRQPAQAAGANMARAWSR